jgi:hypothetical protein
VTRPFFQRCRCLTACLRCTLSVPRSTTLLSHPLPSLLCHRRRPHLPPRPSSFAVPLSFHLFNSRTSPHIPSRLLPPPPRWHPGPPPPAAPLPSQCYQTSFRQSWVRIRHLRVPVVIAAMNARVKRLSIHGIRSHSPLLPPPLQLTLGYPLPSPRLPPILRDVLHSTTLTPALCPPASAPPLSLLHSLMPARVRHSLNPAPAPSAALLHSLAPPFPSNVHCGLSPLQRSSWYLPRNLPLCIKNGITFFNRASNTLSMVPYPTRENSAPCLMSVWGSSTWLSLLSCKRSTGASAPLPSATICNCSGNESGAVMFCRPNYCTSCNRYSIPVCIFCRLF